MLKVYVFAYNRMNLGDDIFLKMLFAKYRNIQFYINTPDICYNLPFKEMHNVHFLDGEYRNLEEIQICDYDAYIYIGGSIFIENKRGMMLQNKFDNLLNLCKENNKPFFYVSSNFGPYKSVEYMEISKSIISKCTDICFREKYSFDLFKDIASVRYAPDLIFDYEIEKVLEHRKDTVGLSVIDFEIREEFKEIQEKYFELLKKFVKKCIANGKEIYLFSFCKYEGDEQGIEKLIKKMSEFERTKIKIVKYEGDIEKFIAEYTKIEYMVCTRFHSMVLSILSEQKIYCLSYSSKMNNVISDLNLNIEVDNIKDIKGDNEIELSKFNKINNEKFEEIKVASKEQLKMFDNFIKNKLNI